jgi:hypothetical protein
MFFVESWMSDVALKLHLPQDVVREKNFYTEGQTTHYGQLLTSCQVK